ncbi:hypothetical protein V8F20_002425 [Naviculisporaceae sp. PSN 640]
MATEADKAIQHGHEPNGVAPGAPNGIGEQALVEKPTTAKPAPAEVPVPEPTAAEPVAPPAPPAATEETKPADAVPPAPVEVPPATLAEGTKAADDLPGPAEQVAPVQTETSTEAPPAPAPVEARSEPASVDEKPLETSAAPAITPDVVSDAPKPNGTTTNGTTTASKGEEDVEMKDAPTNSPPAAVAAAPAPALAESTSDSAAAGGQPVKEPEVGAVAGEKRKAADEVPVGGDALADTKKAKIEETTAPADATGTTADSVPAPTTETAGASITSTSEVPVDGAPAPKKAGRPKKTQKEKVPVSPVGRTLRKTRSQGPVEV